MSHYHTLCLCCLLCHTVHQGQTEEVRVIHGRLGYMLGGASGTRGELGPGETLSIPAGAGPVYVCGVGGLEPWTGAELWTQGSLGGGGLWGGWIH